MFLRQLSILKLGRVIYCKILRNRRKKYATERYAKLSADLYMALPLVMLFDVACHAAATAMGVVPPIEYLNKYVYIAGVYGGAFYLVHRLFAASHHLSIAESRLDNDGIYPGSRATFIVVIYFLLPTVLWAWYWFH